MENIKEFIKERIKANNELFSEDELKTINETSTKLYILGVIDGKQIYN